MITHEQEIEIKNKLIEAKNDQIVKLEMEVERLRQELRHIAKSSDNVDPETFKRWARIRARDALGWKSGELVIKKGNQ